MAQSSQPQGLEVEHQGDVTVVRLVQRTTALEGQAIEALGKELLRLMDQEGRRCFVVNCGTVVSLNTYMLGKLFKVHQRIVAGGGQLSLCQANPFLAEIFKVVGLPAIIQVYGTEQEAVQAALEPEEPPADGD